MKQSEKIEEFLTTILHLLATKFGDRIILRGGLVLRLLESPRLTKDIDCLFVPYRSKNDVVKETVEVLKSLENVSVEYSLNSKCLRCYVRQGDVLVQVEAKVALTCKTDVVSTAPLAKLYNQTPRVMKVMAFDVAMANKLAAWYERRLARDLYDIFLYCTMGITPDEETLHARLKKPIFARNIKTGIEHKNATPANLYDFLKSNVVTLTVDDMRSQLQGLLSTNELLNLDLKIKRTILEKF